MLKRVCKTCNVEKLEDEFSKYKNEKYRRWHCKECTVNKHKAWRYGLTYEEVLKYNKQKACDLCEKEFVGKTRKFDHDHNTGEFRGILCQRCNSMIGIVDDEKLFNEIKNYLCTK